MQRILFLVLSFILGAPGLSRAAIEIDANGHHYDSLQAYLASEKTTSVVAIAPADGGAHRLYSFSVEDGVKDALTDFKQHQKRSDLKITPQITSAQLQAVLEAAMSNSKGPKLLISQPGKMRILSLDAQEPSKTQ